VLNLQSIMEAEELCTVCGHALRWHKHADDCRFEDCDCRSFSGGDRSFSGEPFDPNCAEDWELFLGYREK